MRVRNEKVMRRRFLGETEWSLMTGNWVWRNLIFWKETQLGELKNVVLPPAVLLVPRLSFPQILIPPRRFVTVYIIWILKTNAFIIARFELLFSSWILSRVTLFVDFFLSFFLTSLCMRADNYTCMFVICLSKQIDGASSPLAPRRPPSSTEPNKNGIILHSISPFHICLINSF